MKTTYPLFLILNLFLFSILSAQNTHQADSLVLVDFYYSTGGESWTNNTNWLTGSSLDGWYGISLDTVSGRVSGIELENNNLSGELPDELILLDSLKRFNVSYNELNGNIPELHNLIHL